MLGTLKAEFRKLVTVRTTYVFVGLAILFVLFYAGFIEGYHLSGHDLLNRNLFNEDVVGALTSLPMVFGAIVAILLMTHEYRHNTIMYTLTASNSRTKVLASKFITVAVFALLLTAVVGVLAPLASYVGVHLHGHTLAPQLVQYHSLVWRALFEGWAYLMIALLLGVLIRNQIGAIVSLFVIPTLEQVLGLLLKEKTVYLPFNALNAILSKPERGTLSYGHAALITGAYLLGGWLIAWYLFVRRDAN
ncbi:MAG TPA: ABC transporter permease [Candidatus Saccharimonadales bacterium]|nr:ABC transporter permease [Candidatus Saccharimonadales bacterium]